MQRPLLSLTLAGLMVGFPLVHASTDQPTPGLLTEIETGRTTLKQVLPWLDTDHPELQRLLLEAASQRPEWSQEAALLLQGWLDHPEFTDARERQLTGLLRTFPQREGVQKLLSQALVDPNTRQRLRLQLLQCLARTQLDSLPESWLRTLKKLLADDDARVCQEVVYTLKMTDANGCDALLRTLGKSNKYSPETRLAALECLAPRQRAWEPELFRWLRGQLRAGRPPSVQVAAARTLAASRLNDAQLAELVEDIPQIPVAMISVLLPAFGKSKDAQVGKALVVALEKLPAAAARVADLDRVLVSYPSEAHVRFRPLREALVARDRPDWAHLERVEHELPPGDARRGKLVFQSDKTGCTACHRAGGQGGTVGPNLSRIGVIRGHRDLLESVLLPDAYVAPQFRTYLATAVSGQVHTGLLLQETTEAIEFRTAPRVRTRVALRDLEEFIPTASSLMPRGFDRLLSRQELSDLLEFLASQR